MNDDQLLRYSRHILLPELGVEAQARWCASHVLVIGAGGLGSAVGLYLGASGVGILTVMDDDSVDLTNLQRQIAHTTARVGEPKVGSLALAVEALNPEVVVQAVAERAQAGAGLDERVAQADVVVDCSDNFGTRQAVNAACVRHRKPLVSGAAVGWDGQLSVHLPRSAEQPDTPCYACIFPPGTDVPDTPCATLGVLAPLVGIIGSMQAAEVLKLLAPTGTPVSHRLLMLDARRMAWTSLNTQRDPGCTVCGDR
ncbi:MAG: HesA/MoeB/ThiF family protein [Pseudomonadota bacterium]